MRNVLIQPYILWICFVFGFASGLPLFLSDVTLKVWYSDAGVDIVTIGFLSLVGLPYTLKFLWAPLFDRYLAPFAGRRRGWIIIFQILLVLVLITMARLSPRQDPMLLALLACALAIFSSSLDIVIDAYRTELLPFTLRGMGAAAALGGYRIGLLFAGGIAVILADQIGWEWTYTLLGLTFIIPTVTAWLAPEPQAPAAATKTIHAAIKKPIKELYGRPYIGMILIFIILFKFGDAFAASLTPTFLLQELKFSLTEVGSATKVFGMLAAIMGIFIGGYMLSRWHLFKVIVTCCVLQALANLQFVMLAIVKHNLLVMYFTIFIENLFVGMGSAAILAFIMSICDQRYTASQFAFFSAIAACARVMCGPLSGYIVVGIGWVNYYSMTVLVALPAIFAACLLHRHKIFDPSDKAK